MHGFGRILISIGIVIVIAGLCVLLAQKLGVPVGRLPGDFAWRGKNSGFYFPLATCILLSVLLSLPVYILGRIFR
jgi:ribose/xylose/arabinose/galactoside ABC-type transport system permease subunit